MVKSNQGAAAARSRSFQRWYLAPLLSRPRLLLALVVGVLAGLGLWLIPNDLRTSTRAIFTWDLTCATFILAMLQAMMGREPHHIRAKAAQQDEGRGLILAFVLMSAAASLGAIAAELSLAKDEHGSAKALRIGLVFATVAASWFLVQLIFALHYAHEYYMPDDKAKDGNVGGLLFPGKEPPDYWDFLHFAVVIGVAAQTADVAFCSKSLRRIGTVHGLVAFAFNTVVMALTINLLAALF